MSASVCSPGLGVFVGWGVALGFGVFVGWSVAPGFGVPVAPAVCVGDAVAVDVGCDVNLGVAVGAGSVAVGAELEVGRGVSGGAAVGDGDTANGATVGGTVGSIDVGAALGATTRSWCWLLGDVVVADGRRSARGEWWPTTAAPGHAAGCPCMGD